jgi:hypothetical protein
VDAAAAHARALQQQRSEAAEAAAAAQAQQAARAEAASSAAGVQAEADGAALQQELARWVQLAAAALSSSPPPSSSTALSVRPPQVYEPAELSKQLMHQNSAARSVCVGWMDGWMVTTPAAAVCCRRAGRP